jgi:site-specific DNA recombinase
VGRRIEDIPLPRIAALYPRVSDRKQDEDEKTSLKTQEAGERAWALANGYTVEERYLYRERHSAEEYYERPELTRLRTDAKARRFAIVAVHSVERLSRDAIHLGIIMEELERYGVKVHFVTEPIDDDSPDGQLVRFVRSYAGKIENERKKERQLRAVRERARLGKIIPGARPTYGYQWGPEVYPKGHPKSGHLTKERLVRDDVTAPTVVRMFDEAARSIPLRRIATGLTRSGILTPSGKQRWDPTTVRYILMNPCYCGKAEALRNKEVAVEKHLRARYTSKTRTVARAAEERIALPVSAIPPLVSPALAAQVQVQLRMNQQLAARNNHHPEATLLRGGIARCGYCGYTLYPNAHKGRNDGRRFTYQCTHRHRAHADCSAHSIEAHLLDGAVWAKISEVLRDRSVIEQEVARMRAEETPGADVLAAFDARLADLSAQILRKRRLFEMTDDERTQEELAGEINTLAAQRRQNEAERANAVMHYAEWQEQQDGLAQTLDWCARVGQDVESFTYDEKRATLRALKADVRLYKTGHTPRAVLAIRLPLSGGRTLDLDIGANCDEDRLSSSYQASISLQ